MKTQLLICSWTALFDTHNFVERSGAVDLLKSALRNNLEVVIVNCDDNVNNYQQTYNELGEELDRSGFKDRRMSVLKEYYLDRVSIKHFAESTKVPPESIIYIDTVYLNAMDMKDLGMSAICIDDTMNKHHYSNGEPYIVHSPSKAGEMITKICSS